MRPTKKGSIFERTINQNIKLKTMMSLALFAFALFLIIDGFYIKAKAQYAQYLIADSWDHYMKTGELRKPWPWADTYPVAKLEMYQKTQYVLAGASGRNLAFGPSHMLQTAGLGRRGNAAIAGHRDTHFDVLKQAKTGDLIYLTSRNSSTPRAGLESEGEQTNYLRQAYRVKTIEIVDQHNLDVLNNTGGTPSITLITCYPFDSMEPNPALRYVVTAQLI
jgi:sortase A